MSADLRILLGLDPEELEWKDLALCSQMDTNLFYDDYESSEQVARMVDDICLSCPVMKQCLQRGTDNGEWGVWGGIYLVSGRPDSSKNTHKTTETWQEIKERLGADAIH